ncbi:MAG: PhoH family protein [Alphaproteobacteria bacterium]|nr:PhoH family protein [Alphaproteobacteria bacterium]MDX5369202.1 PhoH family protein [Alphaproteobacteria bacterium]MDX5463898.1 PhoH family protein [Alphaproteobacteria bacterium]
MVTPVDDPGDATLLEFEDNRLLADVMGEHHANLVRLEKAFGVTVSTRGNRVAIQGPASGRGQAADALNALYDRRAGGQRIDAGEVDGAIRLVQGGASAHDAGRGLDLIVTKKRRILPRSGTQGAYIEALKTNELVFGIGPAGTGKTYLAVALAVSFYLERKVDRIILSRPAVEAGERLGFLPGDMREKIDPYLRPLYDALYDMLPAEEVVKRLESGEIEVAPLAFMRGRTLANAFVILDEAQNCTPVQMKMFLTRLGENSRMAITGDPSQVDLPLGSKSGLKDALATLNGVEGIGIVEFGERDVVRHPLVTRIVKAYTAAERGLLDRKT